MNRSPRVLFGRLKTVVVMISLCYLVPCLAGIGFCQDRPLLRQNPKVTLPTPAPPSATLPSESGANNELELPRASPEFAGMWGGHLYSLSATSASPLPPQATSLLFGQRADGTVYFRTGIWGNPSFRTIRIDAQVANPRKIKITEEHMVPEGAGSARVVQKYDILLKDGKALDCLEITQVFTGGGWSPTRPDASAMFRGTLHPINSSQESELGAEILSNGSVMQGVAGASRQF